MSAALSLTSLPSDVTYKLSGVERAWLAGLVVGHSTGAQLLNAFGRRGIWHSDCDQSLSRLPAKTQRLILIKVYPACL